MNTLNTGRMRELLVWVSIAVGAAAFALACGSGNGSSGNALNPAFGKTWVGTATLSAPGLSPCNLLGGN